MCERIIEGNVSVSNEQMAELLKEQNTLLEKQNEILLSLTFAIKEMR